MASDQVGVDVFDLLHDGFALIIERVEAVGFFRVIGDADDGDGDTGVVAGEVGPLETDVGEVDDVAGGEDEGPEDGDLLALADGVGGDKGGGGLGVGAVVGGLDEPAGDVIEGPVGLGAGFEQGFDFDLLLLGLPG